MYPKIIVEKNKLKHNATKIKELCEKVNCSCALVTKAFCADKTLSEIIDSVGVDYFADSRIINLKKMSHLKTPKMLLRIPMISEVDEVVKYADISLNSELKTLKKLDQSAKKIDKIHKVCIMVDLGDLREGYFSQEDLFKNLEEIIKLTHIKVVGIGVNLTCYGAVIPKNDNLSQLVEIAQKIREALNLELPIVSGGNSSSVYLIDRKELPIGVNNLRIGEAFLLGRETAYGENLHGLYQDVFHLECEIVEVKEKPSIPIGEIGVDAFGNKPFYEDKGVRKRAILAIGQQDTTIDSLSPFDENIEILGGSSDHLIVDITDSIENYQVGDIISFHIGYGALLRAFTSDYVFKEYR